MVIPEIKTKDQVTILEGSYGSELDGWIGDSQETTISLATLDEYLSEDQSLFEHNLNKEFDQLYQKAIDLESTYVDLLSFNEQMALYACVCATHSGIDFSSEYSSLTDSLVSGGGFMGEHEDHDHCKCGGHYNKFGKCSDCGQYRL